MKSGQSWGNSVRLAGIFGDEKVILDCFGSEKVVRCGLPGTGELRECCAVEEAASRVTGASGSSHFG